MTERLPDKKRIDIIDAARGFSVILMVIHHALFDAVEYLGAPAWFFYNPVFYYCLHPLFAGLFVFLSGVSSRFSRSNVKRGIKVFAIAVLLTVVTSLPFVDQPIRFGVLHLLGFCMVFYGLTQKVWDKIPRVIAPVLYIVLIVGTALAVDLIPIDVNWLWMFGWTSPDFYSADYFPIFPWLFVFLLGTWAGAYITENRLPKWFYEKRVAVFPAVGKRALLIYILHQPILYGLTMLIIYLQGKG
jgi:uncharacterized membrane protein